MKPSPLHSMTGVRWVFRGSEAPPLRSSGDARIARLSAALNIGPLLGAVLLARGWADPLLARAFLEAAADGLHDPMLLPDMAPAVEMISEAITQGERILVHGDYDVDGIASCALLQRALTALGGTVHTHLPHRITDGYGLGKAAIEKAAAEGVGLLVTADCGTGATKEVAYAHSLGIKVVVTDHHHPSRDPQPGKDAPIERGAFAPEVNPRRVDSQYPFADLSGVGVAFKLVEALAAQRGVPARAHLRFLDLVALGTVADVSPLLGENRVLVKEGLAMIGNSRKVGICALMRAARLTPPVTSRHVAYVLAPRLNAAGRLAHPKEALRLLTTTDEHEAQEIAESLCRHNRTRQEEEAKTLREALDLIGQGGLEHEKVIVLAGLGWHPGVIGIVASRLLETFHRPVFLIALPVAGEEPSRKAGVGSARSIPGFPLWEALHQCRHLLSRYGGHELAAGFSLLPDKIPALKEALSDLAEQWLSHEHFLSTLEIDILAEAADLTLPAVEELGRLEPLGAGNPAPTMAVRDLKIAEISRVGANASHLRLCLRAPGGALLRPVWFGHGDLAEKLSIGQKVAICFNPAVVTWKGTKMLELRLKDLALPAE